MGSLSDPIVVNFQTLLGDVLVTGITVAGYFNYVPIGQVVRLVNKDATHKVFFQPKAILNSTSYWIGGLNDTLTLIRGAAYWEELSRTPGVVLNTYSVVPPTLDFAPYSASVVWDSSTQHFGTSALNGGTVYTQNFPIISGGSATIQIWVKRGSAPVAQEWIVGLTQGPTFAPAIQLYVKPSTGLYSWTGGVYGWDGTVNVCDGAWHLLEASWTPSGVKFFVDGVLDTVTGSSTSVAIDVSTSPFFVLGAAYNFNLRWQGEIDEVSVWNTNLHSSNYTPPVSAWVGSESNLVALYHLDGDFTNSLSVVPVLSAGDIAGVSEHSIGLSPAITVATNIQLPTAATLFAYYFGHPPVGKPFKVRIINSAGSGSGVWTLTTNTGWTLTGAMTIAVGSYRDFYVTMLSSTTATLQSNGTGSI